MDNLSVIEDNNYPVLGIQYEKTLTQNIISVPVSKKSNKNLSINRPQLQNSSKRLSLDRIKESIIVY